MNKFLEHSGFSGLKATETDNNKKTDYVGIFLIFVIIGTLFLMIFKFIFYWSLNRDLKKYKKTEEYKELQKRSAECRKEMELLDARIEAEREEDEAFWRESGYNGYSFIEEDTSPIVETKLKRTKKNSKKIKKE